MNMAPPSGPVVASAPGRVNLIGEHTDYNDGFVLPMPIPQQTRVELTPRNDRRVELTSSNDEHRGVYELGREQRTSTWIDYVQGVTSALQKRGLTLPGFSLHVSSNVPVGAGLSSSAALEVATLRALRTAFSLPLDDTTIAKVGQEAEVDFVGVPTGLMDQLASSLGRPGRALFIDIFTLRTQEVELPSSVEPIIIASGVSHAHDTGGYRVRRAECERAAQTLRVGSLREASLEQLEANAELLGPLLLRRARHVVTENERVLATVTALANGDVPALGMLFSASHASMRDDYEVSVPEIDLLVDLAAKDEDVVAARLTGGGFGGSVVMLAKMGTAVGAARRIAATYAHSTQRQPSILLPLLA
jgi:galactokinase